MADEGLPIRILNDDAARFGDDSPSADGRLLTLAAEVIEPPGRTLAALDRNGRSLNRRVPAAAARPPGLQLVQRVCLRACQAVARSVACVVLLAVPVQAVAPVQVLRPAPLVLHLVQLVLQALVRVQLWAASRKDVHRAALPADLEQARVLAPGVGAAVGGAAGRPFVGRLRRALRRDVAHAGARPAVHSEAAAAAAAVLLSPPDPDLGLDEALRLVARLSMAAAFGACGVGGRAALGA